MKNRPGIERLLDEVVADGVSSDLRNVWIERTLVAVRSRNRTRRAIHGALAMTATLCICSMLWMTLPRDFHDSVPPLASTKWVRSVPLGSAQIVTSKPGYATIVNSRQTVPGVSTERENAELNEIDDQQLLDFFAGKSVALVRTPSGVEELVFADPSIESGFPVQ